MERCLNCDAPLVGPFCAQCGQHRVRANPTFGELWHEALHEFTHVDGRFLRTFRTLLLSPGALTVDFLEGRRARWITPLRLYLICSIAYFASGPVVDRLSGAAARQFIRFTDAKGAVAHNALDRDARAELERIGAKDVLGEARFNKIADDVDALNAHIGNAVVAAVPKVMFLLMPLFAFLTWLAWHGKGLRYPAHLYQALHLHAAWFAAMTVGVWSEVTRSLIIQVIAALGVVVYSTWYSTAALARVLDVRGVGLFVRSSLVGIVYLIWTLVALLAAGAYAILTY